ncbi:hypothetical protein BJ170DRAFT_619141 [Xylariales sp. AK1849]|nr:hypothetical protein BJ170DRAFT_619141 [Xylariales sp. AK1849]
MGPGHQSHKQHTTASILPSGTQLPRPPYGHTSTAGNFSTPGLGSNFTGIARGTDTAYQYTTTIIITQALSSFPRIGQDTVQTTLTWPVPSPWMWPPTTTALESTVSSDTSKTRFRPTSTAGRNITVSNGSTLTYWSNWPTEPAHGVGGSPAEATLQAQSSAPAIPPPWLTTAAPGPADSAHGIGTPPTSITLFSFQAQIYSDSDSSSDPPIAHTTQHAARQDTGTSVCLSKIEVCSTSTGSSPRDTTSTTLPFLTENSSSVTESTTPRYPTIPLSVNAIPLDHSVGHRRGTGFRGTATSTEIVSVTIPFFTKRCSSSGFSTSTITSSVSKNDTTS